MSETILMVRGHMTKWQAFYVMLVMKVLIAVLPAFAAEFMLHKQFNEIDGPEWAVLFINAVINMANVVTALVDNTYSKTKTPQQAS